MPSNNQPQILIQPFKTALIEGHAQKLEVLVRVQAPDLPNSPKKARPPYHLALVIDRSGSMAGEPLAEAVRCARHMVERLAPTDTAALIAFDDRVATLVPAGPVGDRKRLHTALASVHSGGSTDLHGGWQAGADGLLPGAGAAALARVILLSDGNAKVGALRDSASIAACCARAAEGGVTTSTYGLGRDFNEDLMVAMAERGSGNHYYGETAADLFEPFAEEFDLISSLYVRHVRLALAAPAGVTIRQLNDYPVEGEAVMPPIRLPDVAYGAEAWVLVELEVPAGFTVSGLSQLLQAAVTAVTPEGQPIAFTDARLTLDAVPPAVWVKLLPDPLVQSRSAELATSRLLEQARKAAETSDWATIEHLVGEARMRFADQPWLIEVLENMAGIARTMDAARFRKEALYAAKKMGKRLSAKEEMLMRLDADAAMPSYLRRKVEQGKAQFGEPPAGGRK